MDLTYLYPKGMADYFFDTSVMFASLRNCFQNRNIFNLGLTSEVDIFPKVTQGSFLEKFGSRNF